MKTYIIYLMGCEKGYIKAANHNSAERKARKRFPDFMPHHVSVVYTEL